MSTRLRWYGWVDDRQQANSEWHARIAKPRVPLSASDRLRKHAAEPTGENWEAGLEDVHKLYEGQHLAEPP